MSEARRGSHPLTALRQRRAGRALVLDGGLATEVERRGVSIEGVLWSARALIERPDVVRAIHADYLAAGADVISTATYQAALSSLGAEGPDVLRAGVALARTERDRSGQDALVAASMGPYGAHLADGSEYRGDYRVSDAVLTEFHVRQASILWDAGPDLLAFETVPSRREAEAIVRALERLGRPPAWISFSVRDAHHVSAGDPIAPALAMVVDEVGAAGLNCAAPEVLGAALASAGPARHGERLIYPNSGETWSARSRAWEGEAHGQDALVCGVDAWRAAGATVIGGCCRTTPSDIARVRAALEGRWTII